jgi:hypothetical protein
VETHPRSGSSGKEEVERGATLPPSSNLCTTPSHHDVVPLQTGAMAIEHQPKRPGAEAGRPIALPS